MNVYRIRPKLPKFTDPSLDVRYIVEDLEHFKRILSSNCISTENTRIQRYCDYLNAILGTRKLLGRDDLSRIFPGSRSDRFKQPIDWHMYVLREVHELAWINKGLKKHFPNGAEANLKKIVSGRDFSALDSDSSSRDAQFELRVASYYCQSGYVVEMNERSDLIASDSDYDFFIECKRVSNPRKLEARIKRAKEQVLREARGHSSRGAVYVDVTRCAFPHDGMTGALTNVESQLYVQSKLSEVAGKVQPRWISSDDQKVLAVYLHIHIPTVIEFPFSCATRFSQIQIRSEKISESDLVPLARMNHANEVGQRESDSRETIRKLTIRERIAGWILRWFLH